MNATFVVSPAQQEVQAKRARKRALRLNGGVSRKTGEMNIPSEPKPYFEFTFINCFPNWFRLTQAKRLCSPHTEQSATC